MALLLETDSKLRQVTATALLKVDFGSQSRVPNFYSTLEVDFTRLLVGLNRLWLDSTSPVGPLSQALGHSHTCLFLPWFAANIGSFVDANWKEWAWHIKPNRSATFKKSGKIHLWSVLFEVYALCVTNTFSYFTSNHLRLQWHRRIDTKNWIGWYKKIMKR